MRIVLLILLLASSSAQAASLARADSLYALRSEGAEGDRALRTTIAAAIAAYEEAAAEQPQSIEIKWKLLRALFFEGQYTGYSRPERQAWYAEAVDRAEESLAETAELCGGSKTWKRGQRAQVASHCDPDDAAQLYLRSVGHVASARRPPSASSRALSCRLERSPRTSSTLQVTLKARSLVAPFATATPP